jgi:hypothetical protein
MRLSRAASRRPQRLDAASRGTDADDGPSAGGAHGAPEFGLVARLRRFSPLGHRASLAGSILGARVAAASCYCLSSWRADLACGPEATGGDLVCHEATEFLDKRDVHCVIARHANRLAPRGVQIRGASLDPPCPWSARGSIMAASSSPVGILAAWPPCRPSSVISASATRARMAIEMAAAGHKRVAGKGPPAPIGANRGAQPRESPAHRQTYCRSIA